MEDGEGKGNVMDFQRYKARLMRRKKRPKRTEDRIEGRALVDRITRDVHAAASIMLRMVQLARDDMGMPQL